LVIEHGIPCTVSEANFCMNGGTCFIIPTVSTPTCVCKANFEGSRCEHYQLSSFSRDSEEKGMIAAVVIIVLLILVLLGVVIYYISQPPQKHVTISQHWQYNTSKITSSCTAGTSP
uniref:EGF-like domain-containing protein n=1 Tax=Cyprinus carpio TaxID=7962 RepID=A0A8C1NTZ7_CYPCA